MSSLEKTLYDLVSERHHSISEIQSYFKGKTVFVTGATGFVGKLIVEKLLRTCSDVRKIYLLVREKKGKRPEDRLKEVFDVPAFEPLKQQTPDFIDKLAICVGDCLEPNLGLSQEDIGLLKTEVNCILHCAATVRFDASLRKATYINVRAVRDLLNMAKDMNKLTSFIYVSTAYSHCPRNDIDEKVYEPPIKGQQLMDLVESLSDDMLDAITPIILKQWPNTYVFTKAVAEDIVKTEGKGLPASIVKPSIVIGALKEPIPGWIDNLYGAIGVLVSSGIGLLRTLHCDKEKRADMVPVDYVVNIILAAAWNVGQRRALESSESVRNEDQEVPTVYNYVSGYQNPINWGPYTSLTEKYVASLPSPLMIWHHVLFLNSNLYLHLSCDFLLHTIPAYVVDFILLCIGKKPTLVDGYKKIRKLSNVISYFATRQWNFKDTNVQNLWNKLSIQDKEMFEFDIKRLDWDAYLKTYVLGCRLYIMKDPIETLPQGARKLLILQLTHYTLLAFLSFLLYVLLKFLFNRMF